VKYIAFWEYESEDTDKLIAKFMKVMESRKKNPEKHVKVLFPPHQLAERAINARPQGITIFETDDEEKIIDYVTSYFPELDLKIVPLLDNAKMAESYQKMYK